MKQAWNDLKSFVTVAFSLTVITLIIIVAINKYNTDSEKEIEFVQNELEKRKIMSSVVESWAKGGEGAIDISNKITLDWDNFAIGSKSWSVSCAGAYIVDDEAFQALETAYFEGNPVEVEFKKEGVLTMKGQAIITSFPLNAVFNNDLSYSINLQGKGALTT